MLNKKLKIAILGFISMSFINLAYADIIVDSLRPFSNEDLCKQIAGHWTGDGKVSAGLTCYYKGEGDITSPIPGQFDMHLKLKKQSGASCPDEDLTFHGLCENNQIKIQNEKANLHGSLSEAGKAAHVEGKVKYSIFNLNVDINLHK